MDTSSGEVANARAGVALAGAVVAGLFPGIITLLYYHILPGSAWTASLYALNKALQVFFPFLWIRYALGRNSRAMLFAAAAPRRAGMLAGTVFGLATVALLLGLYFGRFQDSALLKGVPAALQTKMGPFGIVSPAGLLVFGLFLIVINSALEEYFWRWFIFGGMRSAMPVWAAVTLSSAAFSLHHAVVLAALLGPDCSWGVTALFAAGTGIAGAVWAIIYHRTGALAGAWLSHLLCDVPVIVVAFHLLRGSW